MNNQHSNISACTFFYKEMYKDRIESALGFSNKSMRGDVEVYTIAKEQETIVVTVRKITAGSPSAISILKIHNFMERARRLSDEASRFLVRADYIAGVVFIPEAKLGDWRIGYINSVLLDGEALVFNGEDLLNELWQSF